MNTNKLVITAILLALGTVMRICIPGIMGNVKPDFLLALLFVAIIIQNDFKSTVATAIVAGILAAMTTNFPGGQIPQLIDKLCTSLFFYFMFKQSEKVVGVNDVVKRGIIFFLATLFSGAVFLSCALFLSGLSKSFGVLFVAIVLPTAFMNIIFANFAYKIYEVFNRSKVSVGV